MLLTNACDLFLDLAGCDGSHLLTRRLALPFAPFPGLSLTGLADAPCYRDHPGLAVAAVSWDPTGERWTVDLTPIREDAPTAMLLRDLGHGRGHGWRVCEPAMNAESAPF
jgi:hypothetical protein